MTFVILYPQEVLYWWYREGRPPMTRLAVTTATRFSPATRTGLAGLAANAALLAWAMWRNR